MSPAEEALHIKRRKEVWEQVQAEKVAASNETNCTDTKKPSKRGRVGEGRPREFAAEIAKVTGSSKVDINRKLP